MYAMKSFRTSMRILFISFSVTCNIPW